MEMNHCRMRSISICFIAALLLPYLLSIAADGHYGTESFSLPQLVPIDNIYDLTSGILFSRSVDNDISNRTTRSLVFQPRDRAYQDKVYLTRRYLKGSGKPETVKTKLQRCRDAGEAYSASWLIAKEHLMYQFTDYNLTWVNCEMGSFIYMNGRANPQKNVNGSLLQSVDVLDFSVVHLSTFERLMKRWARSIKSRDVSAGDIGPVQKSAEMLRKYALRIRASGAPPEDSRLAKTVVIMPFLGTDMGAGHSKLSNRFQYLAACFWSFYAQYDYVVAAVKSDKDLYFAR